MDHTQRMEKVKPRRQEYADASREALVASARELFIGVGYSAASIEQIARNARLTRGALYHHFESKTELFIAVFEQIETETMERLAEALRSPPAPWQAAMTALDAYLDACLTPAYKRIVLEDGPIALGWQRWRALDQQHTLHLIERIIATLIDAGELRPQSTALPARVICAAAGEAAFAVADSEDPAAARDDAAQLLRELLGGLRHGAGAKT